jgi:hypothetical protein
MPGDTYLHDGISYRLTVELGAIVTEPMLSTLGRGGHAQHGEWWWANEVPKDAVLESAFAAKECPMTPTSETLRRLADASPSSFARLTWHGNLLAAADAWKALEEKHRLLQEYDAEANRHLAGVIAQGVVATVSLRKRLEAAEKIVALARADMEEDEAGLAEVQKCGGSWALSGPWIALRAALAGEKKP